MGPRHCGPVTPAGRSDRHTGPEQPTCISLVNGPAAATPSYSCTHGHRGGEGRLPARRKATTSNTTGLSPLFTAGTAQG